MRPTVAVFDFAFLTGSETFVYNQLKGVSEDFEAIPICFERQNSERFPWPTVLAAPLNTSERVMRRLHYWARGWEGALPRRHLGFWEEVLRGRQVRLIHAHFGPAGVAALPLARKLDVPLLVTFHGYDASRLLRNRTYVAALKELFTYARGLTVCDAIRRRLVDKGVAESRLRTHYIGVSLTSFPYKQRPTLSQKVRSGQPARFLQVGRFVEKKGHVYTIQAFHGLLQDGYDCYLELVGDGPLLKACRGLVRDLRIDQRVHFWGAQPPTMVAQLMADADAFVHHSVTARDGDQEGIPLSIMEAMATGLPVAATSHSGIAELVVDGETGRLVPERDVPAYVQALRDLIVADCDMGAESRRVVESRFDLNQQNVELTSIYRSLAE